MSVDRDDKGHLQKGSVLNPAGRPRNAYARVLAEIKQKEFVEFFYNLLDKDKAELDLILDNPSSTNLQRLSAQLLKDCAYGKNPKYAEIFLALIGINVKGITNILINNAGFEDPESIKDVKKKIDHGDIIDLIKKTQEKR